jgi:hypothetical protein
LVNQLAIDDDKAGANDMRKGPAPKRKKRQIAHPLFRNINC